MTFSGFTTERLIGIPPEFFTDVLPAITKPSELKVTLHLFYRISRLRSRPRRLSWEDLLNDDVLRRSLQTLSALRSFEELLDEGLVSAVRRGTVLHLVEPRDGRVRNWYLINTPANRAWAEQVKAGGIVPPADELDGERPSLIELYEQNIGLVTPLLLEELRAASDRYPAEWLEDAIREAVRANVRSWRYIQRMLERWATNGRESAPYHTGRPIDIEKYTHGQLGHLFRRGSDESDL
ncbi:DnaD domain protein [Chloroflexus sp. MS-CIW-1]|jgi:DnaD/phage-associated family protein|uniref:DnaD domain-containing protein n=1 Tax=unclassified Chloroflexus TaxID=2633855 RepID=UPI0004DF6570|nr:MULTISPECIES: DnaD domain protein [unclassified Chloroflexus]MBO9347182.1 DnaD domain protein [Chloroflexus sp.]MDN5271423.1 DnaD domain protein [Chloroflexus sp. MS-CIW-1]